jgi:hypothetical protein
VLERRGPEETVEFRNDFGKAVLTYGGAKAIDAAGRTRPLRYALLGDELQMTLDAAFLASAAFPLTIDPTITVTPGALTFNAPTGGPNPAPQTIKVKNTGASALHWKATITNYSANGSGWLTVSPTQGHRQPGQSKSVTVAVSMTTLGAGTYTATIHFQDKNDKTNFLDVPVTLVVRGPPFIDLQPTTDPALVFFAPTGSGLLPSQSLTLLNDGAQLLTWSVSFTTTSGGSWIKSVTPVGGSLNGGLPGIGLAVTVDATGLTQGTYNGSVTVTGNTTNSPVTRNIQLVVSDQPSLIISQINGAAPPSPPNLLFLAPAVSPAPIPQTVTIMNGGQLPLDWSIDTTTPLPAWLTIQPMSGTGLGGGATQDIQVIADPTSLSAGSYFYTITFAGNASNLPVIIPVEFDVDGIFDVEPTLLTFDAPVGGPNPAPQKITVSNPGTPAVTWNATFFGGKPGWLDLSQTTGTLGKGASQDLLVSIDVTGLSDGTQSAVIIFDDGAVLGDQIAVSIQLSVNLNHKILVSPTSLTADVPQNGTSVTRTLTLQNVGDTGTPLSWTAGVGAASWLSVLPAQGQLVSGESATLTVTFNPGTLPAGPQIGQITIDSTNASNAPVTVNVTMNVNANPTIQLTPQSLVFDLAQNGAALQQTVILSDVGDSGTALDFSGTSNQPWLTISPSSSGVSGLLPGENRNLTVTANPGSLAAGVYTGLITVTSTTAANQPQSIFVKMTVHANPFIVLSPTSLTFNLATGAAPASQNVTLTNSGDGGSALSFTTASNATWLTASPAGPADLVKDASTTITVTVDPSGLSPAVYRARIRVSSTNAENSPEDVTVTLDLTGLPRIGFSPPSPINVTLGKGTGTSDTPITVTNTGGGTLGWTASASTSNGGPWLTLTGTTSGSLTTGQSAPTFMAHVDVTGLASGTPYAGTILIDNSPGVLPAATNAPQTITVNLTVLDSPQINVSYAGGPPPGALMFSMPISGAATSTKTVTVTNSGAQTLNWTATAAVSPGDPTIWLTLPTLTAGSDPGGNTGLDVQVNIASLPAGTYNGTVTVTDPKSSNVSVQIPVTLKILADPAIGVSGPLVFNATLGGANPSNQTVTVTNTGDQTLNWGAAASVTTPAGGAWLNLVPPTSGALTGNGVFTSFDVMIDISGLGAGTYTGMITVSDTVGSAASQQVGVTLKVIDLTAAFTGKNPPNAGYCGLLSVEVLVPVGLLLLYRRRRGGCSSRRNA